METLMLGLMLGLAIGLSGRRIKDYAHIRYLRSALEQERRHRATLQDRLATAEADYERLLSVPAIGRRAALRVYEPIARDAARRN